MHINIIDEGKLCIRSPIHASDVCGRGATHEEDVFGRNPASVEDVFVPEPVDEDTFQDIDESRIDEQDLNTMIGGDGVIVPYYRADTTRVFADNDIMDCSYHH